MYKRDRNASGFMKYPFPDTERIIEHVERLSVVTDDTKRCIGNLLGYRAVRTRAQFPRGPSAAVIVPLFVGRTGELYVLLSRRSDRLRVFAGDTALPGGKVDAEDATVVDTARREAFEEIGLPQDEERIPLLCVMEPHLAKGDILVTPVVVLILDRGLQPNLNASEVTSIFAQPLASFLSSAPQLSGSRMADPGIPYHTFTDHPWSEGGTVRLHRFLTGREDEGIKPVFGLTSAILIKTATIGYGRPPDFEVQPPNAPTLAQQIAYALLTPANPLRIACEREGIDANKTAARLLRPPMAANAARTIEWGMIGMKWKKLMEGDSVAGHGRSSNSDVGHSGGDMRMEELKKPVQELVHGGDKEGAEAKIEAFKKRALEHKERAEDGRDAFPDLATLGAYLDGLRDMVNERMKELEKDEKKLAKAKKVFPKILERVKKQLEAARGEDGDFDPELLFALIPKEGWEGFKSGIDAGKEGIEKEKGEMNGDEGREQGVEEREGIQTGLTYNGTCGDMCSPEQAIHKKRDAKL